MPPPAEWQPQPAPNPNQPPMPPGQPVYSPPGYGGPPGYPAPPYGAPPGYPPMPITKKRRKWPWIVAGIAVVVIVALVIVSAVFGRSGFGDPHTAVQKFWTALVAHDTKKAEKYVCSKKNLTDNSDFTQLVDALTGFDIGAESGSGNTRKYPVTVHLTSAGESGDQVVTTTVTKSTGQWYVCDLN